MSTTTNSNHQEEDIIADYTDQLTQIRMEGNELAVRKARNALFWAGGLFLVWEMIGIYRAGSGFDLSTFIIAVVGAAIFVGLGIWTKTKPYTAVITGLIIYLILYLLTIIFNGIIDGSEGAIKAVFSGIIVRILIIVNLVRPLKDAKELQQWLDQRKRNA